MSKKLAFCTDIHLNFLTLPQIRAFCGKMKKSNTDYLVVTGDISEAPNIETHLRLMEKYCDIPIYFVAGNHDYYKSSVKNTREHLSNKFGIKRPPNSKCIWLNETGVVTLAPGVALLGHDGWCDGGYSPFNKSVLGMADHHYISEVRYDAMFNRDFPSCKQFAQECADHILTYLPKAFETHDVVYLATHVPPFKENSRSPTGALSNRDWMPHFSSKLAGDAILKVMDNLPLAAELIVLSGHTHTAWTHKPRKNILSMTGQAQYGQPSIYHIFDI